MNRDDESAADLADLQKALIQTWNVLTPRDRSLTRENVHDSLVDRVKFLLKHDFDRLTSAMYILDVSEKRFNDAMAAEGLDGKAEALADVIWVRELEKLHLRRQYKHRRSIETSYEVREPDDAPDA